MRKSALLSVDAFAKTEEDVRIRTRSGGIITLSCIIVTFLLLLSEWTQLKEIVTRPQLVVDRDRHLKLDLNMDVTFPHIPCYLLNMDILDSAGEIQLDLLESGWSKTRLDSSGQNLGTEKFHIGQDSNNAGPEDENYCGPCYGAKDQTQNEQKPKEEQVCCQTCEDVRSAYMEAQWAFFDGKNIEQCEREGYVEKVNKHINEGCRIKGMAKLNRIEGNLHFAPGKAHRNKQGHFHDTSLYDRTPSLNFNHIIHHLSFGKEVEETQTESVSTSPLNGRDVRPDYDTHSHQFSYFAKIVPTRFEYLNGVKVETTQFSATYHERPIRGGPDSDHPNTLHSRGGFPSVYFYFEMSPLKVINKQQYAQSWSGFLLNCITSIGGVLAVGTVVDKVTYKAQRSIWGKKSS
ncbi:LANO_0C01134g1_1 [Lachancea nothofagi CBS 11611]|uniref:Endoplasmic reticulum-Golgi intermediate compartment protein n=1 Tax=Lachancea nothofagi CBS 11611 TaxID=1266666 RepID=A0A1G4J421_9SACH|nr:LANO_0C01134g1_1 [Lachancea nothofagi CBS 11611]